MALGTLLGKAAEGIGNLLAQKPDKKQPRINQKQFREMLMQMLGQGGGADVPLPKGRGRGFMRGKDESDLEYAYRKAQGIPGGGKPAGLSEFFAMQDRNLTPEEARIKASIIESEGGQIGAGGTVSKRGIRSAPQSSTGRAYDPVAERKALLETTRSAVAERKGAQAADAALTRKQEESARTPGTIRGKANQYGWGQAKTLTPEEFAKRKPAMVTEGRHNPVTNKLTEVLGWMDKDQQAAGMPASGYKQRLRDVKDARKQFMDKQKLQTQNIGNAFNLRGMS
jgi:hypothetical protein